MRGGRGGERDPVEAGGEAGAAAGEAALDEKLRQAYFWIVNRAVISPFYDIAYLEGPPQTFTVGDAKSEVVLPTGQSYASFALLPLLNLAVRRRRLLVGGPGRGKTASATPTGSPPRSGASATSAPATRRCCASPPRSAST